LRLSLVGIRPGGREAPGGHWGEALGGSRGSQPTRRFFCLPSGTAQGVKSALEEVGRGDEEGKGSPNGRGHLPVPRLGWALQVSCSHRRLSGRLPPTGCPSLQTALSPALWLPPDTLSASREPGKVGCWGAGHEPEVSAAGWSGPRGWVTTGQPRTAEPKSGVRALGRLQTVCTAHG
jgi:hypothetical protein